MNICNCKQDLNKYLCDIPEEFRKGIVDSLCLLYETDFDCPDCQTVTNLKPFKLTDKLYAEYDSERHTYKTSVDIKAILDSLRFDEDCLDDSTIQSFVDSQCDCCTTTSTSTSTTTTSTFGYDFFLVQQFGCLNGNCVYTGQDLVAGFPIGFTNTPGMYFIPFDTDEFQYLVIATAEYEEGFIVLDSSGTLDCGALCPDPTTTTSTSTTSTSSTSSTSTTSTSSTSTTSTSSTTTSSTTTTSSSTTTTTTLAPDLRWRPLAKTCEKEGAFAVEKTITSVSSPMNSWYDTVNDLVYIADGDSPSGNVYWFNPFTITGPGDITYSTAIIDNELYNNFIDGPNRRIYFVGANTNGLLVYNINTNTTSVVGFGTNGPFQRTLLTVTSTKIYCNNGSDDIVIINRGALTIQSIIPIVSLPNFQHFATGPFSITEVGSELYITSNNADIATVGVYTPDLMTNIQEITLPGAAIFSGGNYWQTPFYDPVSTHFYVGDIGSSKRFVINTATKTIIDTKTSVNREGKLFAQNTWAINPITNELYNLYSGLNSSSDPSPKLRVYAEDRTTFALTNMFVNQYYVNLSQIFGTDKVVGTNAGGTFWTGIPGYSTDGTITILSNSAGVENTGNELVQTLEQYDHNHGDVATGPVKDNIFGDADYVPPITNSPNCPVVYTFDCPTNKVTTPNTGAGTLTYEFAIKNSVRLNPNIAKIQVYLYNTTTLSVVGSPQVFNSPFTSKYFNGVISGLTGTNFGIQVRYLNSSNTVLQTC